MISLPRPADAPVPQAGTEQAAADPVPQAGTQQPAADPGATPTAHEEKPEESSGLGTVVDVISDTIDVVSSIASIFE
jgi:hypothetical protein